MATRTITAMFNSRAEAERAVQALASQAGLDRNAVHVGSGSQASEQEGFLSSLKSHSVPDEDRYAYAEGMRRGGAVLTAQVDESRLDGAMDVLEQNGAVDLDEREAEWRRSGWTGYTGASAAGAGTGAVSGAVSDGSTTGVAAMPSSGVVASGAAAGRATTAAGGVRGDSYIPIAEERLTVGKREVRGGRVRVRSYVVETPVQEQVSLRQEHVEVERRHVDRPVTDADQALFQERVIEATESSEEAVVAKEARVVEEVVVRKDAEERVQTVQDKVRRTEVEVEDDRTTGTKSAGTVTGTTRRSTDRNPS
jgi:uncharacterized protein (TIGR02271 family)